MASCPSPEQLVRLLDEELDEADEALIVAHVETCPGCQHRLEELVRGHPPKPTERGPAAALYTSSGGTADVPHQAEDNMRVASPPPPGRTAATDNLTADFTPT